VQPRYWGEPEPALPKQRLEPCRQQIVHGPARRQVQKLFGKPDLLGTPTRWEAAFLLAAIAAVDLFGGYMFNIALSRRTMEVAGPAM
jgi:hypothetical protein